MLSVENELKMFMNKLSTLYNIEQIVNYKQSLKLLDGWRIMERVYLVNVIWTNSTCASKFLSLYFVQ